MSFATAISTSTALEKELRRKLIAKLEAENAAMEKRLERREHTAKLEAEIAAMEKRLERREHTAKLEAENAAMENELHRLRRERIVKLEAKLVESKAKSATMKKVHFGDIEFHYLIPKLQHGIKPERRGDFIEQLWANASTKVHVDGVCLSFYEQYEQSLNVLTGIGIHPESGHQITMNKFKREEKEANDCDMILSELIKTQRQSNKKHRGALEVEAYAIEKELAEAGRALRGTQLD